MAMLLWGGGFLNPQQFLNMFNGNAALIIVACGLTVVMISGGIDISVGGITALVTMACVVYLDDMGGSVPGMMALALGIGLGFGLIQAILIAYMEIQPFIITLAGMFFAKGMLTIVSAVPRTAVHAGFHTLMNMKIEIPALGTVTRTGLFVPARIELEALIAMGVVVCIFIMLRWTRFGRNLYAVGGNNQSALMLGINVKRTRFCAHLLCGFLAGIGGLTYLLSTGAANANNAAGAEMRAIASAIIGGTLLTGGVGNVLGTLFGTLTLLTINNIVQTSGLREPWWQEITTGAMLLIFIVLQSIVLSRRGKGGLLSFLTQRFGKGIKGGTEMNIDNNLKE
jgi:simple sugar transport system permease protein